MGALIASLAGFVRAASDSPAVRDEAGFFTPDTVRKANEEILALRKQFKVDLLIETVDRVASDKITQVREMNAAERNQFFSTWALDRTSAAGIRGVYVLICKDPGHLQVEVGKEAQKEAFTTEDRDKLRDVLLTHFKKNEHDQGLLAAVALVRDTIQRNLGPTRSAWRARGQGLRGLLQFRRGAKGQCRTAVVAPRAGQGRGNRDLPHAPARSDPKGGDHVYRRARQVFRRVGGRARQRKQLRRRLGIDLQTSRARAHWHMRQRARRLFTPAEISRLNRELLSRFRNKEFDQGLADIVRLLREKLAPAVSAATSPPMKPRDDTPKTEIASAADVKAAPVTTMTEKTESDKAPAKVESTARSASTATAGKAGATPAAKDDDPLSMAKKKAMDAAQTQFPTWMWVTGIVGGLLVLWIVIGILRAMFGRGRQGPAGDVVYQRPMPPANPSMPAQNPGAGYARPPQGGSYPPPPQGAGYPMPPQSGYPIGPGPSAPVQHGGGGGGFASGVLGGVVGGAAGSMIYDALRHTGNPPSVPPATSYRPSAPPASNPTSAADGGGYNTGGDFDSSAAAGGSAGGDFDSPIPSQADAGAGGDFDSPSQAQADAGAGGDFDNPAPLQAEAVAGGDFDSSAPVQPDAGGDFEIPSGDEQASGGDFDSVAPGVDMANNDSGGDFGNADS